MINSSGNEEKAILMHNRLIKQFVWRTIIENHESKIHKITFKEITETDIER